MTARIIQIGLVAGIPKMYKYVIISYQSLQVYLILFLKWLLAVLSKCKFKERFI